MSQPSSQVEECLAVLENHFADGGGDTHHRDLLEFLLEQNFETQQEEDWFYFYNIMMTIVVIFCVAVVAGLFLGLMTLDVFNLRIIERSSLDEAEREYAATIIPILHDRHFLLVTLLILNASAYEALPLFLDKMVPTWLVIVLSTTLVLLFGEIVPSAIFIGPQQLMLAAHMVPFVKILLVVLWPIAKPCSMLLDYLVHGNEPHDEPVEEYNRDELSALVNIQYEQRVKKNSGRPMTAHETRKYPVRMTSHWGALKHEMLEAVNERLGDRDAIADEEAPALERELTAPMDKQEVDVVVGALQMKTKVATDVYTPRQKVYAIPDDLVLDRAGVTIIYAKGYSRVPVYRNNPDRDEETNRDCILGFLMTRQLMLIDWDHEREVSTLPLVRPDCVSPRSNLVDLLKLLRSGGSLMAFVCARPDLANRALLANKHIPVESGFMGIVTLEDVLESILQTRIYDEGDIKDRDRAVATLTRWAALKLQRFARKTAAKRRHSVSPTRRRPTKLVKTMISEKTPLLKKKTSILKADSRHGDHGSIV